MRPTIHAAVVRAGLRGARPVFGSARVPLAAKRGLLDVFTQAARPPRGTSSARGPVAGVPTERATPPGTAGHGTLLYLHGGGYALGSARGYRGFAARLAAAAGVEAVVPDYRRSPEHPFPHALDDTLAVYGALVDEDGGARRIVVAGDSAGGGLTLALLHALRDRELPLPAAAGLICPWLDVAADAAGARAATADPLVRPHMTAAWAAPYAGAADPATPGISPLHGDHAGLPPLVVHSAGLDPLAVDAARLVAQIRATAGAGPVEHRRFPDRWHVFHLQAGLLADADRAVGLLGARLRAHLDDAAAAVVAPDAEVAVHA